MLLQDPAWPDRQDQPDGGVDAAQRGRRRAAAMPSEACSNQSVSQQWAGTVPQRIEDGGQQRQGQPTRPSAAEGGRRARRPPSRGPAARRRAPCAGHRPASAGRGSTARRRAARSRAASRPIRTQGSLQLNVARRIASAASDHENENRRMWVRAVASAVRKCSRATAGTSGALSSSSAKNWPAEKQRLHAPAPAQLGVHAQVKRQPRQERAGERQRR